MNKYIYGYIMKTNSYGNSSTIIIDGHTCDIIKLTYEISIKDDNGKIDILKTNNIDGLEEYKKIHLIYNNDDKYILKIIENPEILINQLEVYKEILNNKKSFLGNLKEYIKELFVPTFITALMAVSILTLFFEQLSNFSNLAYVFLYFWAFFLSTLIILFSIIDYPSMRAIYSSLDDKTSYYEPFMAKYKAKHKYKIPKSKKYEKL